MWTKQTYVEGEGEELSEGAKMSALEHEDERGDSTRSSELHLSPHKHTLNRLKQTVTQVV